MKHLIFLICLVLAYLTYHFYNRTNDIPLVLLFGDIVALVVSVIIFKNKTHERE